MERLQPSKISPAALSAMQAFNVHVVSEVQKATAEHHVTVIGMKQNVFVRRARKALQAAGITFHYVEYGSYLNAWKERLAIKLWSGWPTFPQVFVDGVLIGGCAEVERALKDGTLTNVKQ